MIVQVRKKRKAYWLESVSTKGSEIHSAVYVITREWDWNIRKSKGGKPEQSLKTDSDNITAVRAKENKIYSKHDSSRAQFSFINHSLTIIPTANNKKSWDKLKKVGDNKNKQYLYFCSISLLELHDKLLICSPAQFKDNSKSILSFSGRKNIWPSVYKGVHMYFCIYSASLCNIKNV